MVLGRVPEIQRRSPNVVSIGAPSTPSEVSYIAIPTIGLDLPRHLPFVKWLELGHRLSALSTSSAWCLGDWLIYGTTAYEGRYRDAIAKTSLEYQTLRNYAWVTRRFPLSRRRDTLSFGHHAEVAALPEPEQEFWLRKSDKHRWSRNRLRHEVRASLRQCSVTNSCHNTKHLVLRLTFTAERLQLLKQVANKEGLSVEEWATNLLDRAVTSVDRETASSLSCL